MRLIFILSLFLILILSIPAIGVAQKSNPTGRDYSKPDAIAAHTNKTKNLDKLAKTLTSGFTETSDKFRAIFTWIALNIDYDCYAFKHQDKIVTDPVLVISNGKAVCSGYASLFQALCDRAGIETITVSGWAKNSPVRIGEKFASNTDHAWNVIKIDGKWYNCDVTWAAGSVTNNYSKFVKEFDDHLFCMPSENFIMNHYPEDPKWFLGYRISKEEFQALPFFYRQVFRKGISNISPENGILKFSKGKKINIRFKCTEPIQSILIKTSSEKTPELVNFKKKNNEISFIYTMKRPAPYLELYIDNVSTITYKMQN